MRRFTVIALLIALVVALAGAVAAAENIKQVVLPDKNSIIVTAVDKNATEEIEGFRHVMIMFTPAFKDKIAIVDGTVVLAAVSKDKIVDIRVGDAENVLASAPAIPADGYVLYGAGRGYAALAELKAGDPLKVVEKASVKPAKLPAKVAVDGDSIDITGFDMGRGAGELIVFTNDFGSRTWTNEWGFEAVVVKGIVQTVRALGDTEPLDIPAGAWVVSGHDAGASWVQTNLTEGAAVKFE